MCDASSFEQGSVRKVVASMNRLIQFSKYVQQKMSDHESFDKHAPEETWMDLKHDRPVEFASTPAPLMDLQETATVPSEPNQH